MLMNNKIMFDRYFCMNSIKHCKNEEILTHFKLVTFSYASNFQNMHDSARSSSHNLALALRDAW